MNRTKFKIPLAGVLIGLFLIIASLIGLQFRRWGFTEVNIVLIYLLAVDLIAVLSEGLWQGVLASFSATVIFNYLFTSPYFSLSVDDPGYFITFGIMTATSLIASMLTSRVKKAMREARKKEGDMKVLYELSGALFAAETSDQIAAAIADSLAGILGCEATFQRKEELKNCRQLEELRDFCIQEGNQLLLPIQGQHTLLGAIAIEDSQKETLDHQNQHLLQSIMETAAIALERLESTQARLSVQEDMAQERYRSSLLRSISHDLRTPLSGIIGTSEMLMDMSEDTDPRRELALGIYKEANWLHDLVENILNLTRLQDGRLTIHKQPELCEEVVSAAADHILKRFPEAMVKAQVPEEIFMVPMDIRLIEQVLINLLDNAARNSEGAPQIEIQVTQQQDQAVFTILDEGRGIDPQHLDQIFKPFYTSRTDRPDSQRGVGLGLTICEAIVSAHQGVITAFNRRDGQGAGFQFTLPLKEEPQ